MGLAFWEKLRLIRYCGVSFLPTEPHPEVEARLEAMLAELPALPMLMGDGEADPEVRGFLARLWPPKS